MSYNKSISLYHSISLYKHISVDNIIWKIKVMCFWNPNIQLQVFGDLVKEQMKLRFIYNNPKDIQGYCGSVWGIASKLQTWKNMQ